VRSIFHRYGHIFCESEDMFVRLSTRSTARLLLPMVTLLALLGAGLATMQWHGSATTTQVRAAASQSVTFQGHASIVTLAHSLQLSTSGRAHPLGSLATARPHFPVAHSQLGPRILSAVRPGLATATDAGVGSRSGSSPGVGSGSSANAGRLLHNFRGLNSVDSFKANGFVLEPPDQGLCVGNVLGQKVVAEIINDVVAFYTPGGKLLAGPTNLNGFFDEPATENMSDPRCVFDTPTQTFFFTVLAYAPTTSGLPTHDDVLVLRSNGAAFVYRADTTFAGDTAGRCPCFGDQPKVGIDQYNVYVSTDEFGGPAQSLETGAAVIAFAKADLVRGASSVPVAEYLNLTLMGIGVTALQPAITIGSAQQEFFLNSFPYLDEAQLQPTPLSHTLGLWTLSHPEAVSAGQLPRLSATLITSEVYGFPVPALSTNGSSLATFSNDSRMQQVEYINGHLLGALDSAVLISNDPVTRDGAAWFELTPILNQNAAIAGASFIRQGYLAAAGKYLIYPAIVQATNGTTGIAFSITSPTLNPSTGYALLGSGSTRFSTLQITQFGSGPDIGFTCMIAGFQHCRWGDYSWATLDPNGSGLWMAAEDTVPQIATQLYRGHTFKTNWGTQVWEVRSK
jgi:hypothetical protein